MHRIDGMVIYVNAQHACNCNVIQIVQFLQYDLDINRKIDQHHDFLFCKFHKKI